MPEGIAIHCMVAMWSHGLQNNFKVIFSVWKIHESTACVEQSTEFNALLLEGREQESVSVSGSHLVCHSPVLLLPSYLWTHSSSGGQTRVWQELSAALERVLALTPPADSLVLSVVLWTEKWYNSGLPPSRVGGLCGIAATARY